MKRKHIFFVILLLLILICLLLQFPKINIFLKGFNKQSTYEAKIININGALCKLANGKIVQLVGIYIPLGGTNYKEYLLNNIKALIKDRKVMIKIVAYPRKDYPHYPLVIIYMEDGVNINAKLLREGMAFFDHGYYKGKDDFYKLEKEARKQKLGIWGDNSPPKVLFIGSQDWRGIHLKDCPQVKNIPLNKRMEYYFIPEQIYWYRFMDMDCPYGKQHKPSSKDFVDYYYRWDKGNYKP